MKNFLLIVLLTILSSFLYSQTKYSFEFNYLLNDLKTSNNKIPAISKKYSFSEYNGKNYLEALALKNLFFDRTKIEKKGYLVNSIIGNVVTIKIPDNLLSTSIDIEGIDYIEPSRMIFPALNKAVKDSRIDSVHLGIDLPSGFSGKDVIIGITDWGFDYTNPMFYDTLLMQTRIIKAWDQYRKSGPAPVGFNYGTEISGQTALLQAQCDTFNIYEWATHGSHVAGIAGGSGAGTIYRGVAYDANYLLATFLVSESAVLDAFNWMKSYAELKNKRLVINMSWGLYWIGNLDGTCLFNLAIDQMSDERVVFVSSAGNNGDENLHIKYNYNNDTMKTIVGFNSYASYPTMWGQSITIWGDTGKPFEAGLKILNSSNVIVSETPFYSSNQLQNYIDTILVIGNDTIFYNLLSESANAFNNRPHFRLRIKNKNTSYKVALFSTAIEGTVHYWNVIELVNDVGNWGGPFTSSIAGYTAGDNKYSIGDPASTKSLITVAAHSSETVLPNGNVVGANLASFSSIGPTLDERMKPDISAPGVSVCSSISSFTNASTGTPVTSIQFNNRTYNFVRFSGTSMSSPVVTGIVALMLQANPNLSAKQIKQILHQTARKDQFTGNLSDTGSTNWGFGKVHAYNAVKTALQTQNIENINIDKNVILYPNPAKDKVFIYCYQDFYPKLVQIYSLDNKLIKTININGDSTIDVSDLKGIYVMKISDNKRIVSKKLIVIK